MTEIESVLRTIGAIAVIAGTILVVLQFRVNSKHARSRNRPAHRKGSIPFASLAWSSQITAYTGSYLAPSFRRCALRGSRQV
jgi:hypothetical protein